jgi:hypothetical protein
MTRKLALATEEIDCNLTSVELHGTPEDVAAENIDIVSFPTERLVTGMRASSLYDCCTRAVAMSALSPVPVRERIDLGLRLTFEIGNAIHEFVQNSEMIFGDNRFGHWRCQCCGSLKLVGPPVVDKCANCGKTPVSYRYEELHVSTDNPYPCSGHPDLFIRKRDNALRVVELKTISADGFQKIAAPNIEHVWQVQYYLWACSLDNRLRDDFDPNVAYILYISKGMLYKKLPLKMFVEKRNPRILEAIQDKLLDYHEAIKGGKVPEVLPECRRSLWKKGRPLRCFKRVDCEKLG